MRFGLAALFVGFCLAGCQERGPVPSPVSDAAAPAAQGSAPASPASAALPAASTAPAPEAEVPPVEPGDAGRAAPLGGNWLKCYANFQPRTHPELDVLRLGLMCGPSNGMLKLTGVPDTALDEAHPQREHRWRAAAGDCYRIFAVGAPGIEDLDVEVFDPKGARIAWDTSDDRWPIVKADGAFCVFQDGEYRAVARAQRGKGSYAIEIWRLR